MRQGRPGWVFSVQSLEVCETDCCMRVICAGSSSKEMVPELWCKAEGMHTSAGSMGYTVHLAVPFWLGMVVEGGSGEEDQNTV